MLEVTETPTERILVVYWFTYDLLGNQMWLVGAGPIHGTVADVPVIVTNGPQFGEGFSPDDVIRIHGTVADVPVIVTNGPQFGEGFSPDDVIREAIGTLTFTFNDCQTGLVNYDINGFGIGQITIERLTQISGLGCN